MIKEIKTERLILRKPVIEDLVFFNHYAKKNKIGPMAGWMPHTSMAESEFILLDFIAQNDIWTITLTDENNMIGTIGVHKQEDDKYEIGYALDDEYWGYGIMPEAVNAVIEYVFANFNDIDELYCGHFRQNIQSRRVIEKIGFEFVYKGFSEKHKEYTDEVYKYKMTREKFLGGKYERTK